MFPAAPTVDEQGAAIPHRLSGPKSTRRRSPACSLASKLATSASSDLGMGLTSRVDRALSVLSSSCDRKPRVLHPSSCVNTPRTATWEALSVVLLGGRNEVASRVGVDGERAFQHAVSSVWSGNSAANQECQRFMRAASSDTSPSIDFTQIKGGVALATQFAPGL